MDEILGYFIDEPRRLISLGRTVFTAGMLIIVLGLIGLIARTGASLSRGAAEAVAAAPGPTLAQLYPSFWT